MMNIHQIRYQCFITSTMDMKEAIFPVFTKCCRIPENTVEKIPRR